ncbi:MAG: hypothetical protein OXG11_07255 [Chloroflexi bacterium]|nr:hypothetical protein [Chloroflexota bacterium]
MNQFPIDCRDDAARLAANLVFLSKKQIIGELKRLNAEIEKRLNADGVSPNNIVYVALDDPPSSSPAMCRLLRNEGGLSRRKFVASTSVSEIKRATRSLGTGAIVYVDDFAGTGSQFKAARNDVREYIDGTFSEFFVLPCICEEALSVVEAEGVVAKFGQRHTKSERPLLPESGFLEQSARQRLVNHSYDTWGVGSLGFGMLATNVVLSHGAPDTTPMIFRGDIGQQSWFGIVPRWPETESSPNADAVGSV